ncbi:MAG: DUF4468 domain-containing protein [Psychroflexus halocasei]
MKKILLSFVAILFVSCYAAQFTPVSIEPVKSNIQIDDKADRLFVKSNSWMAEAFIDAKSVIQFKDKEAGIVVGRYLLNKGNIQTGSYNTKTVISEAAYAIVKIQVKDNQAKISVAPEDYNYRESPNKNNDDFTKDRALQKINTLISDFKNYMKNDTSLDWE